MHIEGIIYKRLRSLGIDPYILDNYDEPHRFYHNRSHIIDLFEKASKEGEVSDLLLLAIVFHDIVYNPKASDNEEKSAELFSLSYDGECKDQIVQAILDTKYHTPSNPVSETLCRLDLSILQSDFKTLLDYEHKIEKEFQFVDWSIYKTERVKVLRSLQKKNELENLITYVENRTPNIAVYAGSFNPMHVGHLNILQKAEAIFDKVIIARGKNPEKTPSDSYTLPSILDFHQCEEYSGLLTDFIDNLKYDVTLVRGLRNATDFQYESTQLRFMQDLKPDLKMVSLFCDKEFEHISSSGIRQLKVFGAEEKYLI